MGFQPFLFHFRQRQRISRFFGSRLRGEREQGDKEEKNGERAKMNGSHSLSFR